MTLKPKITIYPQYNTDRIEGYQVSISLFVRVHDLEKINQVLDIAIANNANNVGGINLMVDEDKQKELEKGARALAIKQALKKKPQNWLKLSGMTLGKLSISKKDIPIRDRSTPKK